MLNVSFKYRSTHVEFSSVHVSHVIVHFQYIIKENVRRDLIVKYRVEFNPTQAYKELTSKATGELLYRVSPSLTRFNPRSVLTDNPRETTILRSPHSCRLSCSLSHQEAHGASLHRRRIFVLVASFISIGRQWETRVSSGRESLLLFDSPFLRVSPPLFLSAPASSHLASSRKFVA